MGFDAPLGRDPDDIGVDLPTGLRQPPHRARRCRAERLQSWSWRSPVAVASGGPPVAVLVLTVIAVALLAVQMVAVRPVLNRRSDRVLVGEDVARSRAHLVYVACEGGKLVALVALGTAALAA
ncbi:hypothetical protein [Streptomyces agglomeratus]|nr:hypothetical protein [Streptomyces agglomeratus]